ncbi:MAG: hypothetical protein NVSMB57_02540 [Actinomycetota bacterium]
MQRDLLCAFLRLFYAKEWVSGTGGGICATREDGMLIVAPTGVHKEMVQPDDLFVLDPATQRIVEHGGQPAAKPSECSPIFSAIVARRAAGSVVHSHALSSVMAADLATGASLIIRRLEMLKGIRGLSNSEEHRIAVIENTERESDLTSAVERACDDPMFATSAAILVRDHGAYIWGSDLWEAKRHAEVYHFLFEAMCARSAARKD